MTEEAAEEVPIIHYVVTGFVPLAQGKAGWGIFPLDRIDELQVATVDVQSSAYPLSAVKKYFSSVGGVYAIPTPKPGTIRSAAAQYVGPSPREDLRMALWSRSRTAERKHDEAKHAKAQEKLVPLHESLDPVREAYLSLPGFYRHQFLAEIVEYITRSRA